MVAPAAMNTRRVPTHSATLLAKQDVGRKNDMRRRIGDHWWPDHQQAHGGVQHRMDGNPAARQLRRPPPQNGQPGSRSDFLAMRERS
jgi:hypothetical protein